MANKIELSLEKQKKIVDYYTDIIVKLENERHELHEDRIPEWWSRARGDYKSKKNKNYPWVGAADVHVPFTAWVTTSSESRINNAVLASDDVALLNYTRPDINPDGQDMADKIQRYLRWELSKRINYDEKQKEGTQRLCVEGTEIKKVIFEDYMVLEKRYDVNYEKGENGKKTFKNYFLEACERVIGGLSKILPTNKIKLRPYEKIIKNNNIYIVALENFLWWGGEHVQKCEGTAERMYMSYREIMNKVKSAGWINIEQLKCNYYTNTYGEEWEDKRDAYGITDTTDLLLKFTPYEVWGYYDINDDGQYESCRFVIDKENGVMLDYDENRNFWGMRPYVTTPLFYQAGFLMGQGYPARLAGMNDELDTLHNQSLDNSTIINSGTTTWVPNQMFHRMDRLIFRPGDALPVKNHDAVKPLELTKIAIDLSFQQAFVKEILERLGIVTDYSLGREANIERPTASGKAMSLQEFAVNFDSVLQNVRTGLREMISMMLRNLYQYMPSDGIPFPLINADGSYLKDDRGMTKHEVLLRQDLEIIDEIDIEVTASAINAIKGLEVQNASILYDKLYAQARETGEIKSHGLAETLIRAHDKRLLPVLLREPEEIQKMQSMFQQLDEKMQMLDAGLQNVSEKEKDMQIKESIMRGDFDGQKLPGSKPEK